MPIRFTQFLRPDGQRKLITLEVDETTQRLADELTEGGWKFEIELLRTGHVHADCCNEEGPLANFLVPNGPEVPPAVEAMVVEAYLAWVAGGKVRAELFELAQLVTEGDELEVLR